MAGQVRPSPWVALGAVALCVWSAAVLTSANRGLDITDEGFYLLSYRWWDVDLVNFTGVQYLYGPVFELVGWSVAALRVFRWLTILLVHLAFGWTFMSWLSLRRPEWGPGGGARCAGALIVASGGGALYLWLPRTPGYNDVAVLGSLLGAAVVLVVATEVEQGRAPRLRWLAGLGVMSVAVVLAKWISAVLILLALAVPLGLICRALGWGWRSRAFATFLGGAGVAAAALLALGPLRAGLADLVQTNAVVARSSNPPGRLLLQYLGDTWAVLGAVLPRFLLLMVALIGAALWTRRAQGTGTESPAWVTRVGRTGPVALLVVAATLAGAATAVSGALGGGVGNLGQLQVTLVGVLLTGGIAAGAVALAERVGHPGTGSGRSSVARPTRHEVIVLTMLVGLPVVQAVGTGNRLYYVVINGFAAWLAVLVFVATGVQGASRAVRHTCAGLVVASLAVVTVAAVSGQWRHPYRMAPVMQSTQPVSAASTGSLRVDADQARQWSELRQTLEPMLRPAGRSVMAFDEMAGLVLLLDGRSVGEPWYSSVDPQRQVEAITQACTGGRRPWGGRLPLVLYNRSPTARDASALTACGLSLEADYVPVVMGAAGDPLTVYLPKSDPRTADVLRRAGEG